MFYVFQVSYLGLLENVRVRRAGFAYRQLYTRFLTRYNLSKFEFIDFFTVKNNMIYIVVQDVLQYVLPSYLLRIFREASHIEFVHEKRHMDVRLETPHPP